DWLQGARTTSPDTELSNAPRGGAGEGGWFWGRIAKPSSGIRRAVKVDRLRIGDPDTGGFGDDRVREYEEALEKLGKEAGEARRHR
ncbi:hypothetical protein CH063_10887, partial [Colletotrichum higginsianum]